MFSSLFTSFIDDEVLCSFYFPLFCSLDWIFLFFLTSLQWTFYFVRKHKIHSIESQLFCTALMLFVQQKPCRKFRILLVDAEATKNNTIQTINNIKTIHLMATTVWYIINRNSTKNSAVFIHVYKREALQTKTGTVLNIVSHFQNVTRLHMHQLVSFTIHRMVHNHKLFCFMFCSIATIICAVKKQTYYMMNSNLYFLYHTSTIYTIVVL